MDTAKIFRTPGNQTFTAEPINTVEVITQSDMEYISPGQSVTDQQGNQFTVLEIRQLPGRLWKVVLLPEAV